MKKKMVIVRPYNASVFYGELVARKGKEVTLKHARRIWQWSGAQTLSDLAVVGTSKPAECKFPIHVPEIIITDAYEIITMTPAAVKSLEGVPVWTA